jgi:aspartate aminotransferase-like enzyme
MKNKKVVMIPGPTPVVRSIQDQMGREVAAFGDPEFVKDFKEVVDDLNELFNNRNGKNFVIAATGTFGMEMAISNTCKRGDNVLIVSNGFFGDRFIEICKRKGLNIDVVSAPWGRAVSPAEVDEALGKKEYAAMTVTHVDTSTGVSAPIKEIGEVIKKYPNTMYIVDGVCSTAAEPEDMEGMNIDVLFTGSQKAFGVSPGLTMVWASQKALERRESLGDIPEYYADFEKWLPIMNDTSKYFATPAINLVWALKESVRIIKEEGLENRYQRHIKYGRAVQKAVSSLGFGILADEDVRATTLTNFLYFDDINDQEFRSAMLENGVVVAGALAGYAGKAFRLGHMGNADENDMIVAIAMIEKSLMKLGKLKTAPGHGVGVFLSEISK